MDILLAIHSIVRWLVVIAALAVLVKSGLGWLNKSAYQPADRGLMSAFTGLVDTQFLLGVILLIGLGIENYRLEHAGTMLLVVILAHLPRRWRDAADIIRFRNNFLVVVAILVLVFIGVSVLPQGWFG